MSPEDHLKCFDLTHLDRDLLKDARQLGYGVFGLTVPCRYGNGRACEPQHSLLEAIARHADILLYSSTVGDDMRCDGAQDVRAIGLLVASELGEEALMQQLRAQDTEIDVKTLSLELLSLLDDKDEVFDGAAQLANGPGDVGEFGERPLPLENDDTLTLPDITYRFKENALSTISRAKSSVTQYVASPDSSAPLRTAERSIHKLKGLATMFGIQDVARTSHALEWAMQRLREDRSLACRDISDAMLSIVDALERLVAQSGTGAGGVEEVDQAVAGVLSLLKPKVQSPLVLEAPHSDDLHAVLDLDPLLLSTATPFEMRLILDAVEQGKMCYVLTVQPSREILKTSFEPLELYGMLEVAGDVLLNLPILEDVPDISEYDVDTFYFRFKFLVASDYGPDELEDILATFHEMGEVTAVQCNRDCGAHKCYTVHDKDGQKLPGSDIGLHYATSDLIVPSEDAEALRRHLGRLTNFAAKWGELLENKQRSPGEINAIYKDFVSRLTGLRGVADALSRSSLTELMQYIPQAVREASKRFIRQTYLEVRGAQIELDRRILKMFSEPIVDLVVSCVESHASRVDALKSQTSTDRDRMSFVAEEQNDSVVFLISCERAHSEAIDPPDRAILDYFNRLLLLNFGAGDLTHQRGDSLRCWFKLPQFPSNLLMRALHVGDLVFFVPHCLVLSVAGPDVGFPDSLHFRKRPCPVVHLKPAAEGGPHPELHKVDTHLRGTTAVTLGYGLRRLTLLVDRMGIDRRALWIERPEEHEEKEKPAFSGKALLFDGGLCPVVNPSAIAHQLGLDPE